MNLDGVFGEFGGLTNNQAYLYAFNERVLAANPQRDPDDPFLGNTQRRDFLPILRRAVGRLQTLDWPASIFDIGAGKGEVVEMVLESHAPVGTQVHIEEPNRFLLAEYEKRVLMSQTLRTGGVYADPVQRLYRKDFPANQDLVMAIHMIYHLTDWANPYVDPEKDLGDLITFAYGLLKPGGQLFLVYADQERALAGLAGLHFFRTRRAGHPEQLEALAHQYRVRNRLLAENGALEVLKAAWPDRLAHMQVHHLPSRFYGRTPADLAAMALVGEMIPADDQPFDLDKIRCAAEYLEQHGDEVNLSQEPASGPRAGMWGADQPQVVSVITRLS